MGCLGDLTALQLSTGGAELQSKSRPLVRENAPDGMREIFVREPGRHVVGFASRDKAPAGQAV